MSEWWNEERVGKLRELWAAGKSATDISRHFVGEVSRSAVIGKVHRLRLAERDTVNKHTPKTRPSGGFNKPRLIDKPKAQFNVPPPPAPLPKFPEGSALDLSRYRLEGVQPITFSEALERGGRCKWILQSADEKADANAQCCGAPTARGGVAWKPFCETHSRIAYTAPGVR